MDGQNHDVWIKVIGGLAIMANVIVVLLGWIWHRHTKQVDDQKKAIEELGKNKAESTALSDARAGFERKLQELKTDMEKRAENFERRHHDDVEAVRGEMNGLAQRLETAISTNNQAIAQVERNIKQYVEAVGQSFESQMALIVQHSEAQRAMMVELTKALTKGGD